MPTPQERVTKAIQFFFQTALPQATGKTLAQLSSPKVQVGIVWVRRGADAGVDDEAEIRSENISPLNRMAQHTIRPWEFRIGLTGRTSGACHRSGITSGCAPAGG